MRIILSTRHDRPTRMLPGLPLVVPMNPQLSQNGGDLRRLLLAELHPNPLPDHYSQVENSGRFLLEQLNHALGGGLRCRGHRFDQRGRGSDGRLVGFFIWWRRRELNPRP